MGYDMRQEETPPPLTLVRGRNWPREWCRFPHCGRMNCLRRDLRSVCLCVWGAPTPNPLWDEKDPDLMQSGFHPTSVSSLIASNRVSADPRAAPKAVLHHNTWGAHCRPLPCHRHFIPGIILHSLPPGRWQKG